LNINRVPEVPFAQIANSALRDVRLSFRARGILAMILSQSGEWQASRDWIVTKSSVEGRDAIQRALNELTDLGYREVVKEQKPDGTWTSFTQWFHESSDVRINRPTGKPAVGEPVGIENTIKNIKKEPNPSNQINPLCPYCKRRFAPTKPHNCSASHMLMR
jgi:hypothetical protein